MADTESGAVSERLVSRLAEREGTEPTDLQPPLYRTIDLEALDDLFAHWNDGATCDGAGRVEFEHGAYRVRVESDGTISVEKSGESP